MAPRSWKRVGINFGEEGFGFGIHDSKSSFDLYAVTPIGGG